MCTSSLLCALPEYVRISYLSTSVGFACDWQHASAEKFVGSMRPEGGSGKECIEAEKGVVGGSKACSNFTAPGIVGVFIHIS